MDLSTIDAIIFDLGGVIVDIDYQETFNKFQFFSGKSEEDFTSLLINEPIFHQYEKGLIAENEFFERLSKILGTSASTSELQEAWNAMIVDIPKERLEILKQLRKHFRLFVLSNTNTTHIKFVNSILLTVAGIPTFNPLFERVFLSHELGERKPDKEAFKMVVSSANLNESTTLFIDDNLENVESAMCIGLIGLHSKNPAEWINILYNGAGGKERQR